MTLYERRVDSYFKEKRKLTSEVIRKKFNYTYDIIAKNKKTLKNLFEENCVCPDITSVINPNEYTLVLAYAYASKLEKQKLHWWDKHLTTVEIMNHGPVIIGFSQKQRTIIIMYLNPKREVVGVWSFALDKNDLKMTNYINDKLFLEYKFTLFSTVFSSSNVPVIDEPFRHLFYGGKNQDLVDTKSICFEGSIFDEDPLLSANKKMIAFFRDNIQTIEE